MNKRKFSLEEMPQAYFSGNYNANLNRQQLIKNMIKEPECNITTLSDIFFSDENINIINKQLVLTVYKRSKKQIKIDLQRKQDILIVMRYIWIQYARNLPYKIKKQITKLNCYVVGEIAPQIITAAEQNIVYLKNLGKPIKPIPRPLNVNKLGQTLPSISDLYHK